MKKIFEFGLNETEKIVLKSENDLQETAFCDDIEIDISVGQEYRLTYDCLQYTLLNLIDFLTSAIDNKLQLHNSIKYDLGYLWNEDCSGKSKFNFALEKVGNINQWVGERYMLWSSPGKFNPRLATWLYNDEKGQIVLEVTPSYQWHFQDPKPDEKYYIYEEFIKNYQPILFRIISKETAQNWVTQAQNLLQEIEERSC